MVETLVRRDYEAAARLLARKVGKGFKSMGKMALLSALREASGKKCYLTENARKGLEDALRFEQIHAYPLLTEQKNGYHRLYHRGSPVAFMVNTLADPSSNNDKKLEAFLTPAVTKEAKRLTARRSRVR